ncbi:uncharacterized protein N0V89_004010 [Didymosphaeria variabile]|uniref:Uncharacterized protein n=1 Tax=Didymosphaeria variabile TaxID=1932322 RepID=A0A9W8XRM7_9PLEO|nr:uncharacterized protein N0V89_004010 [Didymosphaeria variabile]KAJ4355985.1 hypothetical protein N0V89_004010 [Didymosphaeria variabile]
MPDIVTSNLRPHRFSVGLPHEELAFYEAQLNAEVFQEHLGEAYQRHHMGVSGPFKRPSNPAYNGHFKKPNDTAGGEQFPLVYTDRALQKSKMMNATRKALGPNWQTADHLDDDLENYGAPKVSSDWNCQTEREAPIPDKYLQEFNQMWYEDDEDTDADQLLADMTSNSHAPWRNHLPLRPMYGPSGDLRSPIRYFDKAEIMMWNEATHEAHLTHPSVVEPGPFVRPEPQSFFSWSDSSTEESRGKRLKKSFRANLGRLCHLE